MERRPIRITYRFSYQCRYYRAISASVGETISPVDVRNETRMSAVCHALDMTADEFVSRWGEPTWWGEKDWVRSGVVFEHAYDEEAEKQVPFAPVTCQRCNNEWTPRGRRPARCPSCGSARWDTPPSPSDPGPKRKMSEPSND
jgi:ribosomal protein S27E